jgi:hypothetical protein
MNFNTHFHLAGKHAFLSASKYHWIRYDEQKLADSFANVLAAQEGTELHGIAASLISKGLKLRGTSQTMAMYVNDAIGYRMTPEQILYYSENCFGTADAISFRQELLRIHDLKTGFSKASMDQLKIYTAMFCLEYGIPPGSIGIELRIYQNDAIEMINTEVYSDLVPEVAQIMSLIESYDKLVDTMKAEALS